MLFFTAAARVPRMPFEFWWSSAGGGEVGLVVGYQTQVGFMPGAPRQVFRLPAGACRRVGAGTAARGAGKGLLVPFEVQAGLDPKSKSKVK